MTTFTVLLDEQPLTWTALSRAWYTKGWLDAHRASPGLPTATQLDAAPALSSVVPFMFDRAASLPRMQALKLLAWLVRWLPVGRLRIDPVIPELSFHDPDCPMTNERPEARTGCICDLPELAHGGAPERTVPVGGWDEWFK